MNIHIKHIKTEIPVNETNHATFGSFLYGLAACLLFFLVGTNAVKTDFEKNSIMLETPIPPRIDIAGAKTRSSRTITPRVLTRLYECFTCKVDGKYTKKSYEEFSLCIFALEAEEETNWEEDNQHVQVEEKG